MPGLCYREISLMRWGSRIHVLLLGGGSSVFVFSLGWLWTSNMRSLYGLLDMLKGGEFDLMSGVRN